MSVVGRWPQEGDPAVELRHSQHAGQADTVRDPVTIRRITETLIITSGNERYGREHHRPVREGPASAWELLPPSDVRVLTAQGRALVEEAAKRAGNLARVGHATPEECVTALAIIIGEAHTARARLLQLMKVATRMEQESDR